MAYFTTVFLVIVGIVGAFASNEKSNNFKRGVAGGYTYSANQASYGAPAKVHSTYGAPAHHFAAAAYAHPGFAHHGLYARHPTQYSHQVPAAAIRHVETVGITKTITPVVTKTTTYNTQSEPALSVGHVQGHSHGAVGVAKIAPVQFNTQYTAYAHPTVGVNGPVTYSGPAVGYAQGYAVAAPHHGQYAFAAPQHAQYAVAAAPAHAHAQYAQYAVAAAPVQGYAVQGVQGLQGVQGYYQQPFAAYQAYPFAHHGGQVAYAVNPAIYHQQAFAVQSPAAVAQVAQVQSNAVNSGYSQSSPSSQYGSPAQSPQSQYGAPQQQYGTPSDTVEVKA